MRMSWRQRLEERPSLLKMDEWPHIDALTLPAAKRRQFLRNQKMVAQALEQTPLKAIAMQFHVDPSLLTHLLNRALGGDDEEEPALTQALVPALRLTPGQRRNALDTLAVPAGSAHSLTHLLKVVPGLKIYLDKLLRLFARRTKRGQNLRVDTFHKAFLRYLKQAQWPQDNYPFTVISQGYESLRKYFHRQLDYLRAPKEPTRVILANVKPVGIYEEIQIDEHTVDCHGSVVLILNAQWEPLRLSRITLIAARDLASGCVLGALVVLSRSPRQEDLLTLFKLLTCPWQPLPLTTPGLHYPPGASMPSALGEDFLRPAYGIIRFDNAMMHHALAVRDYVCDTLGATFNLGIPKYPLARVLIESAFKDLNLTVHRFPSTTGSYPTDPIKEPSHHLKTAPVVSLKALEEAIYVHMAYLNQKPLGNLGATSPIDMMRVQMANHWVPLRPACCLQKTNPMIGRRQVPVHYAAKEHRRPWINFAHLRYDAPGVLQPAMRGQNIWIEFDRTDLRYVTAFTLDGNYLGVLNAPETWLRFPHSRATRTLIMSLIKTGHIKADDPFGGYFDHLLAHRTLPTQALELVRINREFGEYPQPQVVNAEIQPEKKQPTPATASQRHHRHIPDWSPDMVDKRRT